MAVGVSELEKQSFSSPDASHTGDKRRVEIVRLAGTMLARVTLEPGWHWAEHMKPQMGTEVCEIDHVAYTMRGRFRVRMRDGREELLEAGDVAAVAQGHDAWVEGDETVEMLELAAGEIYAKERPS